MQFGSLALEYQREQQEQKLRIKQKFLSSLQKITSERNQMDPTAKTKQQAKSKVINFIVSLIDSSHPKQ